MNVDYETTFSIIAKKDFVRMLFAYYKNQNPYINMDKFDVKIVLEDGTFSDFKAIKIGCNLE